MLKYIVLVAILAVSQCKVNEFPVNLKSLRASVRPSNLRIIGGQEVTPHSYPYQVGLFINGNSFCGGALISPNYVLTAGHCGIVIRTVEVILGAHNISNPDENTQVRVQGQKIIIHEEYNDDNLRNDITLIQLAQSVTLNENIQTIPLPSYTNRSYLNEIVTATGWGLPHDVPYPTLNDMSDVLLKVDVAVSNLTECGEYYNDETDIYVTSTNICTSGYRNKGTCDGDSGGPLALDGVLIGITSFGTTQCELCSPSVYTRVTEYLDWIAANSDVEI